MKTKLVVVAAVFKSYRSKHTDAFKLIDSHEVKQKESRKIRTDEKASL